MADLNSWEDDQDAQDEALSQQARQSLNVGGNPQAATFRPGASSFQPFQSQQQHPQYGQNFQQYANGGQYYGGYQGQSPYGQQYAGYGSQYPQGYSAGYGQQGNYGQNPYGQYQQGGGQQQQPDPSRGYTPQQPQQPIRIAQRNDPSSTSAPAPAAASSDRDAAPRTKVLSVGQTTAPKVEKAGQAKVLSIGGDTQPKAEKAGQPKVLNIGATASAEEPSTIPAAGDEAGAEAGAKASAARAVEKTSAKTSAASASSPTPSSGRDSPSRAQQRVPAQGADNVAQEIESADVDQETLATMYGKEHVNVIFLGHVDAGKSTLGGSILYASGMVDERTMEKYKREAKEQGRETWYLSWALDLTKEERAKGKTVEVGRGFFETEKRRYSILDAPGHKNFVPNMIGGASQADVGILVISARKGEYETGFEKAGQTREHAMLAKTQGVNKLVVVVNKMDDPTVNWSEARYNECITKLTVFLRSIGYNPKTDLTFMPISAQTTVGIKDRVPKNLAPWYDGPSLLEFLDSMQTLERKVNAPFMMPISAKYRDMGTMVEGKIEAGVIRKESKLIMMPNKEQISIAALYGESEEEIPSAMCGDQVRIRIRGVEEEDIMPGFVLCSPKRPVHCVSAFEAQIRLLDLRSIFSAGFNCVLHIHSATEEVTVGALLHKLEKGTNRKSKKAPGFATNGMTVIARLEVTGGSGAICVERYDDYQQLGRFTLRDQGQTIAIGKITKLITSDGTSAA